MSEDDNQLPMGAKWLLAGSLVTSVGDALHTLAVGKLLYDRTGSAAAFGGVIIFEQVLTLVTQLVAGPWVDRGDPKRACVVVEVIRGLAVCAASALLVLSSRWLVAWILAMALVIKVARPFYRAGMFALGPAVVPAASLARFNGLSNVGTQGGQLLGVALAGPVLLYGGAGTAFVVNGLTFLFSAFTVAMVRAPREAIAVDPSSSEPVWSQLVSGWRETALLIRREAGLAWHLIISAADLVAVALFNLLLMPIVAVRLHGSSYWLSVVDGLFALGAIVAVFAVTPLTARFGSRVTTIVGIAGQATCFVVLGLTQHHVATLGLAFGIGVFNTISWTVLMTTLQLRARGRIKGRLATVRSLLAAVITAVIVPLIAWAGARSLNGALIASGAVCLAFALVAATVGRARSLGDRLLGEEQPAC